MVDLTNNRCSTPESIKNLHLMDINTSLLAPNLVPIALRKYLFPFRTQKSSSVAAIILRERETSKVPNYTNKPPKRWLFVAKNIKI